MKRHNFTFSILTDKTPHEVFQSITKVRDWWSGFYLEEITGDTEKLQDEFSFRAGEGAHYSRHKLIEVVPDKKIVWLTTDSNLTFIEKRNEWTGTKVIFEISEKGEKTQLVFTHEGLTPEIECYDACTSGWTKYLQNKLLPMLNPPASA